MKFNIEVKDILSQKDKDEILEDCVNGNQRYLKRFKGKNANEELVLLKHQMEKEKKRNFIKKGLYKKVISIIDDGMNKLRMSGTGLFLQSLFEIAPYQNVSFPNDNTIEMEIADAYFVLVGGKTMVKRLLKKGVKKNNLTLVKISEVN